MTKREAAIVGAYTGVKVGEMTDLKEYISELLGGAPVFDATLAELGASGQIKKLATNDFMALVVE